jgi:hypothetical protein
MVVHETDKCPEGITDYLCVTVQEQYVPSGGLSYGFVIGSGETQIGSVLY